MSRPDIEPRRDEGAVLGLVLVLIVVAALIVLPLMSYTMSVLRLNTAVSQTTQDREAARAGLRVAVDDPRNIFNECDGGAPGVLPELTVNDETVTTTCTELDEIGPAEALGYQVPTNAIAVQYGAEVPVDLSGSREQSPASPPYPLDPDWWTSLRPTPDPPPGVEAWDAIQDTVWLPELPRWPAVDRTTGPGPDYSYAMPSGFDTASGIPCRVFFPGRYSQPITLGDGYWYFVSGVYYFDQPITVQDDADVVVGYGLQDFLDRPVSEQSDCADDLQVIANVVSGPSVPGYNGGGATWVFGGDGRLIVDDTAGGSPSIRFNQRYAEEDRGGRVSIMTVNGFDDGPGGLIDHDVDYVSHVPLSQVLNTTDPDNDISEAFDIPTGQYEPSSIEFTDAARDPEAPVVTVAAHKYDDGGTDRGALVVSWDALTGNAAGGSPIQDYPVTVTPNDGTGCTRAELIVDGSGTISCLVTGLNLDTDYDVDVRATNLAGTGTPGTASDRPTAGSPTLAVPDPVPNVVVEATDTTAEARISWDAPAISPAPVTSYTATAERVTRGTPTDGPLVALDAVFNLQTPVTFDVSLPAGDPDGDPITFTNVDTGLAPGWDTFWTGGLDLQLIPTDPLAVLPVGVISYDITDGTTTYNRTITINVDALVPTNSPPVLTPFTVNPQVGTPLTFPLPVYDPDNDFDELTITNPDTSLWTLSSIDNEITVVTTAPDGTYSIAYDATDDAGNVTSGTFDVVVQREYLAVDSCQSVSPVAIDPAPGDPQIRSWFEVPTTCEIGGLVDLSGPDDLGYRFSVVATNAIGDSTPTFVDWPGSSSFDGSGTATPAAPIPTFDIYQPEPIIDIRAGGAGTTRFRVAGYTSIPMGMLRVDNPGSDPIEIIGGVMVGTFDVNDGRANGSVNSVPIGFQNDVVLQRKVRIVSRAGNATSTAVVQVNEDGAGYRVNSWVVD